MFWSKVIEATLDMLDEAYETKSLPKALSEEQSLIVKLLFLGKLGEIPSPVTQRKWKEFEKSGGEK